MIEAESTPKSTTEAAHQGDSQLRSGFRLSLTSVLLATMVIAIWISIYLLSRERDRLSSELLALRAAARELIVEPDHISAVHKLYIPGGETWEVYLPPRADYEIRLATTDLSWLGLPGPEAVAAILPGRHRIELKHIESSSGDVVVLLVDGQEAMKLEKPTAWNPTDLKEGGSEIHMSVSRPHSEPLVLFRQHFWIADGPQSARPSPGPANGILLWIQPL